MVAQVRTDAVKYNPKKIPYFWELVDRDRKAEILNELLEFCRPKSWHHLMVIATDLKLSKIWLGSILAKLNAIFSGSKPYPKADS